MITYTMTLQGRVNRFSDTPCQDAVAKASGKGITALALCDGAGSLKCAGIGAQSMAAAFAKWVCDNFHKLLHQEDSQLVSAAIQLIRSTLNNLAAEYSISPTAFGSTLLVMASDGHGKALAIHLGDGIIAAVDHSGKVFSVSDPEGVNNATYLTCCREELLRKHIRVYRPSNIAGIFASSDGAKDLLYMTSDKGTMISPEIRNLLTKLQDDGKGFAVGFPAFVNQIKPLDDFSAAMLVHDVKNAAYDMGYHMGEDLHKRRIARGYARYAEALRSGASKTEACRRAGWRKRHWHSRMKLAGEFTDKGSGFSNG